MKNNKNNNSNVSQDDVFPKFIDVRYAWQEAKKNGHSNSHLYIKKAGNKGLGVFANKNIKIGEVIEYCHCLPIETPHQWLHDRGIKNYSYWSDERGLIALGFGSIYNSAERHHLKNASYFTFEKDQLIVYVAQRDIQKDEEILTWFGDGFYNYWCDPSVNR
jgi:hypothetical protein